MGIQEDLDALRQSVPGCDVVAFADIGTNLVLVASSEGSPRRELLDQLCGAAVGHFGKNAVADLDVPDIALDAEANGPVRIFMRDRSEPSDAICAICKPDVDIEAYLSNARDLLDRKSVV